MYPEINNSVKYGIFVHHDLYVVCKFAVFIVLVCMGAEQTSFVAQL